MKEDLSKLKNNIKSFISFKKISPHSHWKNILHLFFLLMFLLILFSFYLLYKIKNQQIFQISSTKTEQPNMINEKLLNRVTESFNSKLLKEKEIKEGVHTYKDPSIN